MFGLITLGFIIGLIWLEVIMFGIVGSAFGVGLTIIGIFVTAFIGVRLFRMAGAATLKRMAGAVAMGRASMGEVADGAAVIMAATLLLIPGYATDALGIILFIPGLRSILMVGVLTLLQYFAPKLGRRSFNFSAHHVNMGMGRDENPFEEKTAQTIPDDDDATNVTIEGDYKRHD